MTSFGEVQRLVEEAVRPVSWLNTNVIGGLVDAGTL